MNVKNAVTHLGQMYCVDDVTSDGSVVRSQLAPQSILTKSEQTILAKLKHKYIVPRTYKNQPQHACTCTCTIMLYLSEKVVQVCF